MKNVNDVSKTRNWKLTSNKNDTTRKQLTNVIDLQEQKKQTRETERQRDALDIAERVLPDHWRCLPQNL